MLISKQREDSLLVVKSPVRISFAGGGTDYPDYYENFDHGCVISTTINKFFYTLTRSRNDRKVQIISADKQSFIQLDIDSKESLEAQDFKEQFDIPYAAFQTIKAQTGVDIFMAAETPPGSGLGGSGAVAVNLIALLGMLSGQNLTRGQLAEKAFHINSTLLNMPIGKQDEYASAFGGINQFIFRKDRVEVTKVDLKDRSEDLQQNLMLLFLGYTRSAKDILSSQLQRLRRQEPNTLEALDRSRQLASDVNHVLLHGNLDDLGIILNQGWEAKKRFTNNVSNALVDKIYSRCIANGAIGGKLTGAGGGGFMLLYCKPERQNAVEKELANIGVKRLNFRFDNEGTSIEHD